MDRHRHLTILLALTAFLLTPQAFGQQLLPQAQNVKPHALGGPVIIGAQAPLMPVPSSVLLKVQTLEPRISVGSMVILQAVIQNNGQDPLLLRDQGDAWVEFKLILTDASGKEVPLTRWGESQVSQLDATDTIPSQSTTLIDRPLASGASVTYQFVLNRQFDMSEAGVYHVTVTRPCLNIGGKMAGPLVSNTVDVELMEPTPDIEAPQNVAHF